MFCSIYRTIFSYRMIYSAHHVSICWFTLFVNVCFPFVKCFHMFYLSAFLGGSRKSPQISHKDPTRVPQGLAIFPRCLWGKRASTQKLAGKYCFLVGKMDKTSLDKTSLAKLVPNCRLYSPFCPCEADFGTEICKYAKWTIS